MLPRSQDSTQRLSGLHGKTLPGTLAGSIMRNPPSPTGCGDADRTPARGCHKSKGFVLCSSCRRVSRFPGVPIRLTKVPTTLSLIEEDRRNQKSDCGRQNEGVKGQHRVEAGGAMRRTWLLPALLVLSRVCWARGWPQIDTGCGGWRTAAEYAVPCGSRVSQKPRPLWRGMAGSALAGPSWRLSKAGL